MSRAWTGAAVAALAVALLGGTTQQASATAQTERGKYLVTIGGCSDCHTPHGTTAQKQLVRATINETCFECHAEKRGPMLWEHEPVTEDCSLCHAPHGSTNTGMLKLRGPILCQSCHSQQGHPSFAYGPQGLPGGSSPATALALGNCTNCHTQVHGSNHPSGSSLTR